jgi:uncharacterized protein (DUF1778 family)
VRKIEIKFFRTEIMRTFEVINKSSIMNTIEKARYDTRLTKEQKDFFEYAANLGGYRTLTEFVIVSLQEKSKEIVEEHNKIIASKRDQEIFFNELTNPSKPNKALTDAVKRYKEIIDSQ